MNSNRNHAVIAAISAAVLGVTLLTGCGSSDKDRDDRRYCPTTQQVLFFGTDGHYHYGSPKGKVVPANQVPHSARKVPGYKAPKAPKVDLNKGTPKVPGPATVPAPAKAPAPAKVPAPAPRR